jgi:hypothetical protein
MQTMQTAVSAPSYYRHVDGGIYRFFTEATHTDGLEPHAVYEHLWPFEPGPYVRPMSQWRQRFAAITEAQATSLMQGDRAAAQQAVTAHKASRREAERQMAQTPEGRAD